MTLLEGTEIKHYSIRSLIGKGGMGEVYLADDKKLGRQAAIKILNPTDDIEKIRRFRQEAKAISALNHPNILTIHDFDQTEDFYFIVSEYINGKTLRNIMKERSLPLEEVLETVIQIGNALTAAHELHIIHRDIKPENVMVLSDGFVKVLDFGLAKLQYAEMRSENLSDAPTASVINTEAGFIIGTVNYMSPEQLRGQKVDERTDIWSLGTVFYELLAGRKPFAGESVSDTIAAVLNQPLPKLKDVPLEVSEIVAKALEKDREKRFSSAHEFASELKKLKISFLTGSLTLPDLSDVKPKQNSSENQSIAIKNLSEIIATKPRRSLMIFFILLAIIFSAGALSLYLILPNFQTPSKQIKVSRLSTAGNTTNAVISSDGRFIAYIQNENGNQSLWLRQTDETSGKELFRLDKEALENPVFAPDGNSIYFTKFEKTGSGALYRIPLFGGSQREILKDLDSAVSFSPDGNEMAFLRSNPGEGFDQLIISGSDGSNQKVLTEKKKPFAFALTSRQSVAWSADGKSLFVPFGKMGENEFMSVVKIDKETGQEKSFTEQKWSRVGRVAATKEKDFLLITAAEFGTDLYQIVSLNTNDGTSQKITNEISDFFNISLDNDSERLLATTNDKSSAVSLADTTKINLVKPIAGGGYDGIGGVSYTSDGRIVFVSIESGNPDIWVMNEDGSNRRQLTFDKSADDFPVVSKDNQTIVFVSNRKETSHIWRMNFEGGDLRQLTDKGGEQFPRITPDGKYVVFSQRTDGRPTLWKVSLNGGEPQQITTEQTHWADVSPNGNFIACLSRGNDPESPIKLSIVDSETGKFLNTFEYTGDASPAVPPTLRWMSDGEFVSFVATKNGVSNILAQSLNGDGVKKLTDFSADRIFSFDFSADGKKIALARGVLRSNLLLITDF